MLINSHAFFYANFMLPIITHVIGLGEFGVLAKMKLFQGNMGRLSLQVKSGIVDCSNPELKQVDAFPIAVWITPCNWCKV